jgi:TonB family protein
MIAVNERAKQDYEILSKDASGRVELIRIKGARSDMVRERCYPDYPNEARAKHITGEVRLSVRVGKNGRVQEAKVESGPLELHKAAIDAMKQCRFVPTQIDGSPVEVQFPFVFEFHVASQD